MESFRYTTTYNTIFFYDSQNGEEEGKTTKLFGDNERNSHFMFMDMSEQRNKNRKCLAELKKKFELINMKLKFLCIV